MKRSYKILKYNFLIIFSCLLIIACGGRGGEVGTKLNAQNSELENDAQTKLSIKNTEPISLDYLKKNRKLVFDEDFNEPGFILDTNTHKNFRIEPMEDPLHRAGNSLIDRDGKKTKHDYESAVGKRWSAWYDKHQEETAFNEDGYLVMKGLLTNEKDPTRSKFYKDSGVDVNFGQGKIYTSWVDTWTRKWSNQHEKNIADPDSPNKVFKYGYFETKVNFSEMNTPGFRLSIWLMPASTDKKGLNLMESNAYNDIGSDGVEIDIFEYEFNNGHFRNNIIMAVHGGGAGSSNSIVKASDYNINLEEDDHIISFLWAKDKMLWFIDGRIVKEVTDKNLIPHVYSYLIVSREMNSGVKDKSIDGFNDGDVESKGPYRPRDPGLYGENAWLFKDRLSEDKAKIDYIQVWQ